MTADFDRGRVDLAREGDFQLGSIHIRPATRQVESRGSSETLEPRIMQVLVVLARRRGEVVSRDDLIETCWEGRVVGDDALNRCISKIRKIGEASGAFRLETIPRVGYRLHGTADADVRKNARSSGWRLRRPAILAAVAVLAAVFAGVAYFAIRNSRIFDVQPVRLTVALQEFTAIDRSPETQTLGARISRAILDRLTREGVPVVEAAGTSQSASAKIAITGDIDQKAGVAAVSLRINDPESGVTLWSTTAEFGADEIDAMPEILATIVTRPTRWVTGPSGLLLGGPNGVQAEQARLRAIQRADDGDERGAMEAARQFRDLAPRLFFAHNVTSFTSMGALPSVSMEDRRRVLETAREARAEVQRLQPSHAVLIALEPPYEYGKRISTFRSRAAVDPGTSLAVTQERLRTGQLREAEEEIPKALASDASWMSAQYAEARALVAIGERSGASAKLDKAMSVWRKNPKFRQLRFEMYLFLTGETGKARAELERKGDGAIRAGDETRRRLGKIIDALDADATAADVDAARRECATPSSRDELLLRRTCLSAMVKLGQLPTALKIVDELYPNILPEAPDEDPDQRWLAAPPTAWEPIDLFMPWMGPLRADPKIVDVFKRLGLLDYWRETKNWPDFCEDGRELAAAYVCTRIKTIN